MKAKEYKKLCRKIHRLYGRKLNMSYFDSCSVCDAVYFGEISEAGLIGLMDAAVIDEAI